MDIQLKYIVLESTDTAKVHEDIRKLIPDWNGESVRRLHPDGSIVNLVENDDGELVNESHEHISGNRVDIIQLPDKIVDYETKEDEDGNEYQSPIYGGYTRYKIEAPDYIEEQVDLAELDTLTHGPEWK